MSTFDERIDELNRRMEQLHEDSMRTLDAYIEATDAKLIAIGRQNAALSEMVEILGGGV